MKNFGLKRILILTYVMLSSFSFNEALAQSFIELKITENDLN